MPELPEVETICNGLKQAAIGKIVEEVLARRFDLRVEIPRNLPEMLVGQEILDFKRRGKYILVNFSGNKTMIVHLGMSGSFVIYNNFRNSFAKHDHVIFKLNSGQEIVFNDPRRFGLILIEDDENVVGNKFIAKLGIEPLEDEFEGAYLFNLCNKRKVNIKALIMNANLIVGVGNIYASESLFLSKILPIRNADSLNKNECEALVLAIKEVLRAAIKSGGSTLRDYITSSGEKGYFQHNFNVYGKQGQPCVNCQNMIEKIIQNNRSSFYCGNCQE